MTKQINALFAVLIMVLLMIATRGHDNWLSSFLHLPDFTIPALFIAGVYFRKFWAVFTLILSSVAIDNYVIVHQGVSANCITPAYSLVPLTYYGIFWISKAISTLAIDNNSVKNAFVIITATCTQWFAVTSSYYFFTATYSKTGWGDFPAYIAKWSIIEIPTALYWMVAVIIVFTLAPRINPALKLQKSA
ncbi:Optional hypothetical component of the B12 transporter BtuM [uncultured Gammaproteobacteria bacterium]|jgi:membrane-associated HD superfamily phosphohydrolase|uniref:Optional hypothetical component of the B12 transporter BtuM n=1 Tax=Bathymodiolus azoricus thioautotrophic gill symbiont TaxID=235205 RepID=A0ACA8ZTX1_9GAMM|nr:hypothetical protein [Bathymodiolus azoricus thioautotrophic gill symbiont]CAC9502326.1 Optional hypothetical component of the B12 transporter BtuM [uncultured Gammaproteobacteria bacterium]CAB5502585.1 Optional hypothetical component of the B12 transporter BtuM [Bathymodiolus azoricus thioautotrophic gill symbiont]CAC9512888.1 Optional hypothetical component of the B12 transporter BtuM [uncultured Gammaproteobacteria bacterium]CAC9517297.1 Optional hypothetical component of the B12 transpor